MRKVFSQTITIWKVKFICKCGAFSEFVLHNGRAEEIKNRSEAYAAIPSYGFNGWNISKEGKEMCPVCAAKFYANSLNRKVPRGI